MSYSTINQMQLQDSSKMTYFHLECQTLLKKPIMSFFAPTSHIFRLKTLECNFIINKINLIVFINATFFMKTNPRF